MKAGWKTVKLGEVARYDKAQGIHSGLPYVGLEHIESGTRRHIGPRDDAEVQSSTFLFNPSHVLYGRLRPYLRKVLVPDFAGHCSTEIFPILPSSELDRSFLSYWLISESTTTAIDRLCNGARMPRANMEQALDLEIPLPPLAEQKRIVALLDEAFAGIDEAKAKAQRNGINVRSIFESHLTSTFAHRATLLSLSSFADEITDGDHAPPPKAQSGIPFITISDIDKRTGSINFRDTFKVPEDYYHGLKPNKKPRVGDILYTVTGATLGIPVMVRDKVKFCFQRHIGLIRPNANSDSRWLTYALRSPQAYKQACLGSTGAAQKTVSLRVLRNLQLPEASPSEQKEVAAKLNNIENEIFHLEKLMEKKARVLAEMKLSILAQAFAGELTA